MSREINKIGFVSCIFIQELACEQNLILPCPIAYQVFSVSTTNKYPNYDLPKNFSNGWETEITLGIGRGYKCEQLASPSPCLHKHTKPHGDTQHLLCLELPQYNHKHLLLRTSRWEMPVQEPLLKKSITSICLPSLKMTIYSRHSLRLNTNNCGSHLGKLSNYF